MSSVEVFHQTNPTSNRVADVISVLDHDNPSQYRVEWASENRNHATTYPVEEFRFGNGPKMKIHGKQGDEPAEYLIDSNPPGRPQLVHLRKDGYRTEERLTELKVLSERFHWKLQVKHVAEDLQRKLNLPDPRRS